MTKIESLTPEQTALFPAYVKKWVDIGLSTEPVDLDKAKAAIRKAYDIAGLTMPEKVILVDGPNDYMKLLDSMNIDYNSSNIFNNTIFGSYEASWLSHYDYFKEVVGIKECEKLDGLMEISRTCGMVHLFDDMVVVEQKPILIKFDDEKRLHCENGPAILYRDGFAVYSWRGTRIPSDWIEDKDSLTPQKAITWENIEQRRCACEILGWARILRNLDAKTVDSHSDPEIGTLVSVNIPDVGEEKFLIVLCGTRREFALPVPPEMKTALEAQAWTWGMEPNSFVKPEVRT